MQLADVVPQIDPDRLIAELIPPPRFDLVRFDTYRPDPSEPSQAAAVTALTGFAAGIGQPARRGWFRKSAPPAAAGVYLDGGFGVGKTHLLASLWHAVPGPKAYGTFVEYTHLVGRLGFAETVRRLSGHALLAVDEFELDDPGDTMLMSSLLGQLSAAGVFLAATSNTLPGSLGEGRFAADDFRREIQSLSDRFQTIRVDGPDFRHVGLAPAPDPLSEAELIAAAESAPHSSLDDFDHLTAALAKLHPSGFGHILDGVEHVNLSGVHSLADQSQGLRWVVLIDRLYDRDVPVRASGARLDQLFTKEMIASGYRKKYLRATSRIMALAREGARQV